MELLIPEWMAAMLTEQYGSLEAAQKFLGITLAVYEQWIEEDPEQS